MPPKQPSEPPAFQERDTGSDPCPSAGLHAEQPLAVPERDTGSDPDPSVGIHAEHPLAPPLRMDRDLSFQMPGNLPPMRLDAALGVFLPRLGLRARRRLWDWCRVMVNNSARKPGFILRAGDHITVSPVREAFPPAPGDGSQPDAAPTAADPTGAQDRVTLTLVAVGPDFIALHKAAGVHSAHIAGSSTLSLERELARRWPEILNKPQAGEFSDSIPLVPAPSATHAGEVFSVPRLLTRLDRATSGLVLAARHTEAETRFRRLEKQGLVRKTYLALLRGRLEETLYLRRQLDTDNRKRSRVLPNDDPDPARHSMVTPLRVLTAGETPGIVLPEGMQDEPLTLACVEISRGARHQIRAHLADAGFPIAGEWLYVDDAGPGEGPLYLHHARMEFPGFSALCLPDWGFTLPAEAANALF